MWSKLINGLVHLVTGRRNKWTLPLEQIIILDIKYHLEKNSFFRRNFLKDRILVWDVVAEGKLS